MARIGVQSEELRQQASVHVVITPSAFSPASGPANPETP
jgi:hypothetical protein